MWPVSEASSGDSYSGRRSEWVAFGSPSPGFCEPVSWSGLDYLPLLLLEAVEGRVMHGGRTPGSLVNTTRASEQPDQHRYGTNTPLPLGCIGSFMAPPISPPPPHVTNQPQGPLSSLGLCVTWPPCWASPSHPCLGPCCPGEGRPPQFPGPLRRAELWPCILLPPSIPHHLKAMNRMYPLKSWALELRMNKSSPLKGKTFFSVFHLHLHPSPQLPGLLARRSDLRQSPESQEEKLE